MQRLDFGNTWWGEKWLDSLNEIDYSNRLPRGVSYARKGAVLGLKINNNQISARVQGSRPSPYKVGIVVPKFSKKEKETISKTILTNRIFLSSLFRRQLATGLYDTLLKEKINLFPTEWSDLDAECSCPDWAVPCKHIAAVIYLIANKIDQNPFLVFLLHSFDIFKVLDENGYTKEQSQNSAIFSIKDIKASIPQPSKIALHNLFKELDNLDFSTIPFIQEQIFSLIEDKPLFYPGDFKKILNKVYKKASRLESLVWSENSTVEIERESEAYVDLTANFNAKLELSKMFLATKDQKSKIDIDQNPKILINFLKSIHSSQIQYHSHAVIMLYFIFHFVSRLLEQGAFVPQLIKIQDQEFQIRWLPALFNKETKIIYDRLLTFCPQQLAGVLNSSDQIIYPSQDEQLNLLISFFLQYRLRLASREAEVENHPITDLFFQLKSLKIKGQSDQELPQTINLWLSKFFISHKDFVPLIKITPIEKNFCLDLLVEKKSDPLLPPLKLAKVMSDQNYNNYRPELMRDLAILTEHFPDLTKVIEDDSSQQMIFSSHRFANILFEILPVIRLLGISILLPKELEEIIKPKITLSVSAKRLTSQSYFSLSDMLSFSWRVAIGNQFLSAEEFKKLVQKSNGIVKIKDDFVYFDELEIKKLLSKLDSPTSISTDEALRIYLASEYKSAPIELSRELKEMISSMLKVKKIPLPSNLRADLRPYQERGFWWLYRNIKIGFGSLIADDMGLGKTIQVITVCLKLKQEKLFKDSGGLVIVPTTLLTNWQREIEKFTPDLKVVIYHGQGRKFKHQGFDLMLTTYGTIRRESDKFAKISWPIVIIDEAQNIKNVQTSQTKIVKSIRSKIRIAMTGTPVENRLSEYWSIANFLNGSYLGNLESFKKEYIEPIEMNRDQNTMARFQKITAPFLLRRLKTDKNIIKDLPDKNEINQFATLTKDQVSLYQSTVDRIMKNVESSDGIERRGLVFQLMTALKQVCNHPAHYLKKNIADPTSSGKILILFDILKNIYENNEKVIIFTQYTEMGHLLVKMLKEEFKTEILFFHGGLSRNNRDVLVDQFQNEKYIHTMILSLKAGGTGLNLTAATNVIHFDLWWNPAVEAQATDRAYRIGQTKNVMVHRLITKDTFEEKINDMIQLKKELANLTVTSGEKWLGELSNKELRDLFKFNK